VIISNSVTSGKFQAYSSFHVVLVLNNAFSLLADMCLGNAYELAELIFINFCYLRVELVHFRQKSILLSIPYGRICRVSSVAAEPQQKL
jgi:hypothetical protein